MIKISLSMPVMTLPLYDSSCYSIIVHDWNFFMYELTSHLTPPIPNYTNKTKPNHNNPYQTIPYLQLSITAILIHNATLPFSEDRDCKPFSACFLRHPLVLCMEHYFWGYSVISKYGWCNYIVIFSFLGTRHYLWLTPLYTLFLHLIL